MNNKIVWKHDEEKDYYELIFNNESVLRFAVNINEGYWFWVSEMLNVEYECGDFHSIEETKKELEDIYEAWLEERRDYYDELCEIWHLERGQYKWYLK